MTRVHDKKNDDTPQKEGVASARIGTGAVGFVMAPPPASLDPGIDVRHEARRRTAQYVMKIDRRTRALHSIRISQHIRHNWPPSAQSVAHLPAGAARALCRSWAAQTPEDFYALTLSAVANRVAGIHGTTIGDSKKAVMTSNNDDRVGVYQLNAGRPWPKVFTHVEARVAGTRTPNSRRPAMCGIDEAGLRLALHILEAVLALHAMHVTHCDLHAGNILVDDESHPRLIDFDNACIEPVSKGGGADRDGVWRAQPMPRDGRLFTALLDTPTNLIAGRWQYSPQLHVRRDWHWLGGLLASTWPPCNCPESGPCRSPPKDKQVSTAATPRPVSTANNGSAQQPSESAQQSSGSAQQPSGSARQTSGSAQQPSGRVRQRAWKNALAAVAQCTDAGAATAWLLVRTALHGQRNALK